MCSPFLKRLPHTHQGTNSIVYLYRSLNNQVCILKAADISRQQRVFLLANEYNTYSTLGQVISQNQNPEQKNDDSQHASANLETSSTTSGVARASTNQPVELGRHPNIIKVFGFKKNCPIEEKKQDALVLEYCRYGSLLTVMENLPLIFDPWNQTSFGRQATSIDLGMHIGVMRSLFKQLCSSIAYIHSQGVCHLDIQLSNILLGEHFQVKLCDFGNSKKAEVNSELKKEDVLLLGSILFSLIFGEMLPKANHLSTLKIIKLAVHNKIEHLSATHQNEDLSSLISLIASMVQQDSQQRPSILDIQQSEWMNSKPEYQVQEVLNALQKNKTLEQGMKRKTD